MSAFAPAFRLSGQKGAATPRRPGPTEETNMSNAHVIRAWKDAKYRASLSQEQREALFREFLRWQEGQRSSRQR